MQFPLRATGPCAGKRVGASRNTWIPGLGIGLRNCTCRQAQAPVDRAPEGESTTASSAALANNNTLHSDDHKNVIDVDAQAIVPSSVGGDPKPAAATSDSVEGDWQEPQPGDWGGTVDPQGIKEPDSSGVLFFFIIIAGLSLCVHQLLRYLGSSKAEERLAQPSTRQATVAVSPASRAKLTTSSMSKPGASVEATSASTSTAATGAAAGLLEAVRNEDGSGTVTTRPEGDSGTRAIAAVPATQIELRGDMSDWSRDVLGTCNNLVAASETETGSERDAELKTEGPLAQSGLPPVCDKENSPTSGSRQNLEQASGTEARASSSESAKPLQQGLIPEGDVAYAGTQTQPLPVSSSSTATGIGGTDNRGELRVPSAAPKGQAIPRLGPGADAGESPLAQQKSPLGAASAFFASGSTGPAAALVATVEPSGPARLSLPAVRPEPLSRALDSSALANLPNGSSVASLRERTQLSLRAAAAAVEASQRAAAYAAAASNAASRAAEAAERAAAAATLAQTGLENAAESAIAAAEARIAQAAEAAKDAEERAASAAAHSTAYQDMSQSQADIAERAAAVQKPSVPGPLSQLQQLWRSASSAFVQGHHQSDLGDEPSMTIPTGGASSTDSGARGRGGAYDGGRGTAPGRNVGAAAAETISSTVKGLMSWLGQGDGTR
ncbi:hypothetical protein Vafri_4015 [Volvox africanus]|uniref:Uncharacterized protein n=1 Tax=Volvox africanus TaxID=51714 RepID=A0A8J4AU47_9CHLO|nr:hypothetical protein Vafri_4015 [Volvox africanus]